MRTLILALVALPMMAGWPPPKDKIQHFVAGAGIGVAATISFRWSGGSPKQSARIGFLVSSGTGVAKEYADYRYGGGRMDAGDALATVAGAALGSWMAHEVIKDRKP